MGRHIKKMIFLEKLCNSKAEAHALCANIEKFKAANGVGKEIKKPTTFPIHGGQCFGFVRCEEEWVQSLIAQFEFEVGS